jgi:hypothetical protein
MNTEKLQKHNYGEQNLGSNEQQIRERHQRILESLSPEQKQNYYETVKIVNQMAMDFTKSTKLPFKSFDFWLTDSIQGNHNGQVFHHEKTHLIYINERLFSTIVEPSEIKLSNIAILAHEFIGHELVSKHCVTLSNQLQTYRSGLSVDRIRVKVKTLLDSEQTKDLYKKLNEDTLTEEEGKLLEKLGDIFGIDELMYILENNLEFTQTDHIENLIGTKLDEAVTDYISDIEVKVFLGNNQNKIKINYDVELDKFGYSKEKSTLRQIPYLLSEVSNSDINKIKFEFYQTLITSKRTGSVKTIIDFIYNKTKSFDNKGFKINPKSLLNMDISGLADYVKNSRF